MPLLNKFDTPAGLRDVPNASPFYMQWSNFLKAKINDFTAGDNGGGFFDPTFMNADIAGTKALTWMGFPRDEFFTANRDDKMAAFRLADSDVHRRSHQNEYFEWYVERNAAGKITKVTFVTELPEYYQELWDHDRQAVVDVYNSLVGPGVQEADLHTGGNYNRFNRWNTTDGIVHDIQTINNLTAAIRLCQGSVSATIQGSDNYDTTVGLGAQRTAVDPRAAYDVNMLARKGLLVTLADPIGVYIADWDNSGITRPNGTPAPDSWWSIVRGTSDRVLRLEYSVPRRYRYTVGDLKLGGRSIQYGGQLAQQITVVLHGLAATRSNR